MKIFFYELIFIRSDIRVQIYIFAGGYSIFPVLLVEKTIPSPMELICYYYVDMLAPLLKISWSQRYVGLFVDFYIDLCVYSYTKTR